MVALAKPAHKARVRLKGRIEKLVCAHNPNRQYAIAFHFLGVWGFGNRDSARPGSRARRRASRGAPREASSSGRPAASDETLDVRHRHQDAAHTGQVHAG